MKLRVIAFRILDGYAHYKDKSIVLVAKDSFTFTRKHLKMYIVWKVEHQTAGFEVFKYFSYTGGVTRKHYLLNV